MRTPLALFAFALVVRLGLVALFADAAYPDSAYYVAVARSLAAGRGFEVDFVWIFAEVGGTLPAIATLPVPSNAHWMPLASIVQVPFIWLLGPTAVASAMPFVLLGAITAPLAWVMARDVGATERVATGAGVLVAVPLLVTPFMVQPDNFALYQVLTMSALWAAGRGLRGDARAYALAGALVGLATLSRSDGWLVGLAVGLVFLVDRVASWRGRGRRPPAIPLWAAVACAGLFLLVLAPWFTRQLVVFGSISPSTATGRVLFIRTFAEWNSITTPATLQRLLDWGWEALLGSRLTAIANGVVIFTVLGLGALLAPFAAVGAWARRRSPDFIPVFLYAAVFLAGSAVLFAVHVPGGMFIHSAVGLLPHTYVLTLEGLAIVVVWVARRRASWQASRALHVFTAATLAIAVLIAVVGTLMTHASWRVEVDKLRFAAAALDAARAPRTDRVMSMDASGLWYWSGRGGVVLVNDSVDVAEEIARAYGIRWLVLQRSNGVASWADVLNGRSRPSWIGPPVATEPAAPDGAPAAGPVDVGLYPVCLTADDPRCAEASR